MIREPVAVIATLALMVALSEWLARRTWLRHLGSALLVIVLAAVAANAGLIPTYGGSVVYDAVFATVGPLAIFWLLLEVDLRRVLRAGPMMIVLFLIGSAGTVLGVLAGIALAGGEAAFGPLHWAVGGMFVGTYTGGSINFNAVALQYGVVEDGVLYAGAAVVDSAMTTVWMAATVALPRLVAGVWPKGRAIRRTVGRAVDDARAAGDDRETATPADMALLAALGGFAVWISEAVVAWTARATGVELPSILVLTTLALLLAQLAPVQRLAGKRLAGWLAVMLFLAVIGALCDVGALRQAGPLGLRLLLLVAVAVGVHGAVVFGAGAALGVDADVAAVASQANVGGSTSALALARSLGRPDLALPAVLVGALGNALGTYLGFLCAAWLR